MHKLHMNNGKKNKTPQKQTTHTVESSKGSVDPLKT